MLTTVNTATAILNTNLQKQGRIVLFSPLVDFGDLSNQEWADLGYFPADATIAPTNNVNRTDVTAANREGGPDVILARNVTSLSITYDTIPALTPDDVVRRLHNGATPKALATTLSGVEAYSIDPSAVLQGRMIIVRKRPTINGARVHQVTFHPRVDLTPAGVGDSNGQQTLIFSAAVQAYDWTPSALLGGTTLGQYGASFEVPDGKLQALLDELGDEAAPAVTP